MVDINLINFKVYKGLYIIYEEKSKEGKFYNGNDNCLLYEGEFLYGKKMVKVKNLDYLEIFIMKENI